MPDRVVLVTGASGRLGGAVVAAFERDGWKVVATGIEDADLTSPEEAQRVVREAGDIAALAHLVGGFAAEAPVESTPVEDFDAMFALNLRPAYLMLQAAIPVLKRTGGPAVCVGSRAGQEPFGGASGYCASKAAVHALVQTVAQEGIRCNAVVPRVIEDPEAVAEAIVFLCEPRSGTINGALVPV